MNEHGLIDRFSISKLINELIHCFVPILVLIASTLLLASCQTLTIPDARIQPANKPIGLTSAGDLNRYFKVMPFKDKQARISFSVEAKDTVFFQPNSIRLAYWNTDSKQFEILKNSSYKSLNGVITATVSKHGVYGVFGLSRIPYVRKFQSRLCVGDFGRAGIFSDLSLNICKVVLCPDFSATAWSDAFNDGTGVPVSPGMINEGFGNVCELCFGNSGRIESPECGIVVGEPGTTINPPAVEQITLNIPWGGRAVAVAVHPTLDRKMIVASETGGLFKTTNSGDNWTNVSGAKAFDFTDVQYLPTDANVVIAAARRDTRVISGGGIWRSDDGGDSWTHVSITPPTVSCSDRFAAYALNYETARDRLWAATECGIAYSNDKGLRWTYMPASGIYTNNKTYAIETPAQGHIKILTKQGVYVTADDGVSWTWSNTGIPANIRFRGVHNTIAVSSFDHTHIYRAVNFRAVDAESGDTVSKRGIYYSTDNGANWSELLVQNGINRPEYVRVTKSSLSDNSNAYDLYYGNGSCWFGRTTVTHDTIPAFSEWTRLNIDHCDPSDVSFRNDGKTPLLLTSDGGLHKTTDDGLNWTITGSGDGGYNALQITEVTGQLHRRGDGSDFYFATQDNEIWASANSGRDWTGRRCCEGFFLNIPREPLPSAQTRLTGVSCARCMNFISEPILANQAGWPNPSNNKGNPKLLKPGFYIHNTRIPGVDANLFNLSNDTGVTWTPSYGFPEQVKALSQVAGPQDNPTIYTAVKRSGATSDGGEKLGIKRITGVLGSGEPVVSDVNLIGSIGTFPTMFAWYKPYGVDPSDPNFLIAPDIENDVVQITRDGGSSWAFNPNLTDHITGSGTFRFNWRRGGAGITQVSNIAFNPECDGHIMVGTRQAGILQSFNNGNSWTMVRDSRQIPRVSSFYFTKKNTVIASSYGRGLWKINYQCPDSLASFIPDLVFDHPVVFFRGVLFPLKSINPGSCPRCRFILVNKGNITGIRKSKTGDVTVVLMDSGGLETYSLTTKHAMKNMLKEVNNKKLSIDNSKLIELIKQGNKIKGLVTEDKKLKGYILSRNDVTRDQLPRQKPLGPYITTNLPQTHGKGLRGLKSIVVSGHGFKPGYPLEVSLDGVKLKQFGKMTFDDKGIFRFEIPPVMDIGDHTLHIRQKTNKGILEDIYVFNLTVKDFPLGKDPDSKKNKK